MKTVLLWSLALLNVVLLISLCGHFFQGNAAYAQAKRPGDYTMIPGRVNGNANGFVYIVDSGTGQLGAMSYDGQNVTSMQPIDLSRIFEAAAGNKRHN